MEVNDEVFFHIHRNGHTVLIRGIIRELLDEYAIVIALPTAKKGFGSKKIFLKRLTPISELKRKRKRGSITYVLEQE